MISIHTPTYTMYPSGRIQRVLSQKCFNCLYSYAYSYNVHIYTTTKLYKITMSCKKKSFTARSFFVEVYGHPIEPQLVHQLHSIVRPSCLVYPKPSSQSDNSFGAGSSPQKPTNVMLDISITGSILMTMTENI